MRAPRLVAAAGAAALLLAAAARAQESAPADTAAAAADTAAAAADTSAAPGPAYRGSPPPGGFPQRGGLGAGRGRGSGSRQAFDGFFGEFSNEPKAGVRAGIQQYLYYGEWKTELEMRDEASFENKAEWSWADYRKQIKTVERRGTQLRWSAGEQLPLMADVVGSWDWSEDNTTNSSGVTNLSKRDYKLGSLSLKKMQVRTGALRHNVVATGRLEDQKSVNQGQRNDFSEATASLGGQTGWEVAPGVALAGRLHGTTTSGTRSLGERDSPSSASGDSVGVGMYYQRAWTGGRVHVTRANFEKRYLDFRRNSNGLIDTMGAAEEAKIVQEQETRDAVSLEFENTLRAGPFTLETEAARTVDEQNYRASGKGLTEKENNDLALALSWAGGRDSLVVSYDWLFRWDDQRYKNATANRGKQWTKNRDLSLSWFRTLFRATELAVRWHQGLSQEIAEDQFNDNDKDRLDTDASVTAERAWPGFRAKLAFDYRRSEDLSIRASRSSNNNVKDSYSLAPGYTWDVADWLQLTQSYNLYIQYTDYLYSYLPTVTRADDYNKRGNLNTQLVVRPTRRLELVLKNDYNKRFNATKTGEDAAGGATYFKDQIQRSNKLNLEIEFEAAQGVVIEAATFRQKDVRDNFGTRTSSQTTFAGEIWVGAQVKKSWGDPRGNKLELSAMVRKYNAYGPSITETSADYWDADVWLKWSF